MSKEKENYKTKENLTGYEHVSINNYFCPNIIKFCNKIRKFMK